MKPNKSRNQAFTLVEIMVVVAIIGLLAAIAIPNFVKARVSAQMNTCINNLNKIDGAVQQWAIDNKKASSATVDYSDISSYLKNTVLCPTGGTTFDDSYTLNTVADRPLCQKLPSTHKLSPDTTN